MSYRDSLPQLDGGLFLTDGGIETVLIFHEGLDLPAFAAFDLLKDDAGTEALRRYYDPYASLAREPAPRLRAREPDVAGEPALGGASSATTPPSSTGCNRKAIALMEEIRDAYAGDAPVVISGCIGPHDDGYQPGGDAVRRRGAATTTPTQIETFADTAADMVTRDHDDLRRRGDRRRARRARGRACRSAISFTVETDGRLPSGQSAGRRDRAGRRATTRARLLHDQLRAPDPLRGRARRRAVGAADPRACAPTRRRKQPRRARRGRPSSTTAIPTTSAARYAALRDAAARSSTCWAAAAAPTTAT